MTWGIGLFRGPFMPTNSDSALTQSKHLPIRTSTKPHYCTTRTDYVKKATERIRGLEARRRGPMPPALPSSPVAVCLSEAQRIVPHWGHIPTVAVYVIRNVLCPMRSAYQP